MLIRLISVIIPNYNYAHLILETLESVKAQTYPYFECIVVDDGSTDNSVKVIQEFIKSDNRFQLLQKTNGGLPSTRNEGIKIAKGDYIAFLDSDDLWEKDKLKNQIQVIDEKNADVVFSNSLDFNENGVIRTTIFDNRVLSIYDFLANNPIPGCASNFMIKEDVISKVGLFDNDMRSSEDLEFLFRVSLNNFTFCSAYFIDVKIRKHSNSMQTNYLKMFVNKMYCFDKCLKALVSSGIILDKRKYRDAILKRFQSMVWTARDAKRNDLIHYCYWRTRQLVGWNFYFTTMFWSNYKYDLKTKIRDIKKIDKNG